MALLTGLRKTCGNVIRIQRALVIFHVAAHTGGATQIEDVVDMAITASARRDGVSASERKTSRAVIELRVQPRIRAVTESAVGRKTPGSVARDGILEIR